MLRVVEKGLNKTLVVLLCAIYYSCCTTWPLDGAALVFCWLCYMNFFGYVVWYIPRGKLHCHFPSLCLSFMSLTMAKWGEDSASELSFNIICTLPLFRKWASDITSIREHVCTFSFSLEFLPMIINLGDFPLQLTYSNLHDIGLRACASEKIIPSLRFWFG